MPRLPGPEALGNLPSLRSGSRPAQISAENPIATAAGRVGTAMVALSEDERQREEALQVAEADAELNSRLLEARRRFDSDPDWRTFQPRFDEEAQRIRTEAGNRIQNPRVRERWQPRSDMAIANSMDHVIGRQNRMRGEHEYDRLDRVLGELGTSYLAAPDDATRDDVRRRIEETIELGRRTGVIPADRIRDLTRRHLQGSIEADALGRRDSYAALLELREGDSRARAPSSGNLSELGLAQIQRTMPRAPGQTATERAAEDRRIRTEAARISQWITRNFVTEGDNPEALPLTQLQHDALVGMALRNGRHWQDVLSELIPSVRTGNWDSVAGAVRAGGLTNLEQPAERRAPASGPEADTNRRGDLTTPEGRMVATYNAFRRAGFSDAASRALVAEVGRENDFRPELMFGAHNDPANQANNVGIMSWQGNRRTAFLEFMRSRGFVDENGRIEQSERALNAQAEFVREEMSGQYGRTWAALQNPNVSREEAARLLGTDYIRWRYTDPEYQSHHGRRDRHHDTISRLIGENGATQPPPELPPADPRNEETAENLLGRGASNRYSRLPPDRRRALITHLSNALRPELQAAMESDLELIRQTGQPTRLPDGTTHFERAARVLTPSQFARYRLRLEEAYGQYRALNGLQDMTAAEIENHLNSIAPNRERDGDSFAVVNRNYNMAVNAVARLREAGRTDPARSVETGLTLRGIGQRQRQVVSPDGQTITTGETDVDHRLQPAREVRDAHALVRRRFADDLTFTSDATGNLVIERRDGRPNAGRALQEAWGIIIDARLAAQIRRGITQENRSPLTRAEAADLLRLPRRMSDITDTEFNSLMQSAVARAEERYGSYARMALDSALRFANMNERRGEEARYFFQRSLTGESISRQDVERMIQRRRIDAEESSWLGQGIRGVEMNRFPDAMRPPSGPDVGGFFVDRLPPTTERRVTPEDLAGFSRDPRRTERTDTQGVTVSRRQNQPTPERINHLRRYPHLWRQFDEDYGEGAASEYLRE